MSSTPPQVYPSVDWLTMTVAGDSAGDEAYQKARALAVEQAGAGERIKPWGANGFRGFGTPHLRCGYRNLEVLVELSGSLAERYWQDFHKLSTNVSRLDTCVTVTFPRETRDLAIDGFKAERVRPRAGFPAIRKTIWEQAGAGQTLYLGSPKSARMGRLYDKTAESGGEWPAWSWRWEVQERRDMGGDRARLLDGADDVHRAITAGVHGFFSYHGVTPWFQSDGPVVLAAARRTRTDLSRYRSYLTRSIAPGMRRWIDAGHGHAILAALNLDDDELLAQLGLAVVPSDSPECRGTPPIKESSACLPARSIEDLTPPLPWPTRPLLPDQVPPRPWPIQPVTAAAPSSQTSRTGST